MFDEKLVLELEDYARQRIAGDIEKTQLRRELLVPIKERLRAVAGHAVERFEEENRNYVPAEQSIEEVIKPFWRSLYQGGVVDYIHGYYSSSHIRVSDEINYLRVPSLARDVLSGRTTRERVWPLDYPTLEDPHVINYLSKPLLNRNELSDNETREDVLPIDHQIRIDDEIAIRLLRGDKINGVEDVEKVIGEGWFSHQGKITVLLRAKGFLFWTGGRDKWTGFHGMDLNCLESEKSRDNSMGEISSKVYADFGEQVRTGRVNEHLKRYINREVEGINKFRSHNLYELSKNQLES